MRSSSNASAMTAPGQFELGKRRDTSFSVYTAGGTRMRYHALTPEELDEKAWQAESKRRKELKEKAKQSKVILTQHVS